MTTISRLPDQPLQQNAPRPPRFLVRLSRWPVLLTTGVVFVVSAILLFFSSLGFSIPTVTNVCGLAPPDVRFYSSAADVEHFLEGCGPAGREAYRNLQLVDLIYPAVAGLAMSSALAMATGRLVRRSNGWIWLSVLPLVGMVFDYLENAAAWVSLARFPGNGLELHLLGLASAAKQATSWLAGLALVLCILMLTGRWLAGRRPSRRPKHDVPARSEPATGKLTQPDS